MIDHLKLKFRQSAQEISRSFDRQKLGKGDLSDSLKALSLFEEMGAMIYRIRKSLSPKDPFRKESEDLMSRYAHEVLTFQKVDLKKDKERYASLYDRYRLVWRTYFSLFVFTLCFFLVSLVTGWIVVSQNSDMAGVFLDQNLMEAILEKKAWFQDMGNPLSTGLSISFHNMKVSFFCFILSGLFGFGGVYYLAYNGLFFGAIMAYCHLHGFDDALGAFVVAHGVLELSLIVCATFAGLIFGRVFFMRPLSLFKVRFKIAVQESLIVIAGVIPWFLLCGLVESFISPQPDLAYEIRWAVGAAIAFFFWIFTFAPITTDFKKIKL